MVMPRPKGKALKLASEVVPALKEKQNLVKAVYGVSNPLIEEPTLPPVEEVGEVDAFQE